MSMTAQQTGDPTPPLVQANRTASRIDVANSLAQDLLNGNVMDIKSGPRSLAMFSNPFNGGKEELLYVDDRNQLLWLRHTNGGSGDPALDPAGWVVEFVDPDIDQVVVAVHPQGGVWAIGVSHFRGFVVAYELVQEADGRTRWLPALIKGWVSDPELGVQLLPVQYLADRPATALVFVVANGSPENIPHIFTFSPLLRGDDQPYAWQSRVRVSFDPVDRGADLVAGYDDASLNSLRLYARNTDRELWMTRWVGSERPTRQRITDRVPWYTLSGWTTASGFGAVGVAADEIMDLQDLLGYCPAPNGDGIDQDVVWRLPIDQRVDDVETWQDAEVRLHLYGRAADGGLYVVHQLNWSPSVVEGCSIPVWDTHSGERGATATTRPLLENVARFNVDAYPDDMPSQHVMHGGVPEGESCVIYTQSVTTSFWAREKVRLVQEVPDLYSVPRYQSTLTVRDAYGTALPQWPVKLTSDSGVDLEINGRFYRTGPVAPVVVNTDGAGRITIRIVASGLSVGPIEASCNGLAQNVSINPAADVHRFLGGAGTLPNHSAGFNAEVIEGAKTSNGEPLFPKIRPKDSNASWPPSAEEVAAWCRGVFAVDAGHDLQLALTTSSHRPTFVAGFSLQTFDPTRPGFSVYATVEDLASRRASIAGQVVSWDGGSDWLGDLWHGIRNGVLAVVEVVVNVVESAIELVVQLADAIFVTVSAAWDDIVSAAHAVEAAFVAIGAAIMDAVHWLQQLFGLDDAWHAKEALQAQFACWSFRHHHHKKKEVVFVAGFRCRSVLSDQKLL